MKKQTGNLLHKIDKDQDDKIKEQLIYGNDKTVTEKKDRDKQYKENNLNETKS